MLVLIVRSAREVLELFWSFFSRLFVSLRSSELLKIPWGMELTSSCSTLTSWWRARRTRPTTTPGATTPSAKSSSTRSWTKSARWPKTAPASRYTVLTSAVFGLFKLQYRAYSCRRGQSAKRSECEEKGRGCGKFSGWMILQSLLQSALVLGF